MLACSLYAAEIPRAGTNFITTKVYTEEEDAAILKAFEGLRVADVSDGMDAVGLHNIGLMDSSIHCNAMVCSSIRARPLRRKMPTRLIMKSQPASGSLWRKPKTMSRIPVMTVARTITLSRMRSHAGEVGLDVYR